MMRFEYQFDDNNPKIIMELSPESDLDQVCEAFGCFLRGAGYIVDGDIVLDPQKNNQPVEQEDYSENSLS